MPHRASSRIIARTAGGQFIIGMQALPGSPYDGHTLSGLERNHLAGAQGDAINAVLAAAGTT